MSTPPITSATITSKWNALCDKYPGKFRKVNKFRPGWLPMLHARNKDDYWRDNIDDALKRIPRSRYLMGDTPRDAKYAMWRPNMEWFLRPDTIYKLLDGDYEESNTTAPDMVQLAPHLMALRNNLS